MDRPTFCFRRVSEIRTVGRDRLRTTDSIAADAECIIKTAAWWQERHCSAYVVRKCAGTVRRGRDERNWWIAITFRARLRLFVITPSKAERRENKLTDGRRTLFQPSAASGELRVPSAVFSPARRCNLCPRFVTPPRRCAGVNNATDRPADRPTDWPAVFGDEGGAAKKREKGE